jgi:hypothetical protein
MPSPTSISMDKLSRLIGLPKCPQLIDVRTEEDFTADPRLIPGAIRRDWQRAAEWARSIAQEAIVYTSEPMMRLASIVRAADTASLSNVAEASGLLAISLGLSRMFSDDLEQLEAGMLVYDALYRWCRDATDETHNWPTNKAKPQ